MKIRNLLLSSAAVLAFAGMVNAEQYNETLSKSILYYATATFCDEYTLQYWNCGSACKANPGVGSVTILESFLMGTFGFTAYNNQTNDIIVAFRGSYDFMNWYSDFDYFMIPYPNSGAPQGAQVHGGFYNAYQSLADQVFSSVQTLLKERPTASLTITGHSLGGAMATFAAVQAKELKITNKINFYSYGSPRTGNPQFADYIMTLYPNGAYQRVVHYDDIVPHLPITAMGFYHAGNEVWYDQSGDTLQYKVCQNQPG